jgi:hypothetical protein
MKQANLYCAIGAVYEKMEYQQRANEYYESDLHSAVGKLGHCADIVG